MSHPARFEKWDRNGTWNVSFPAHLQETLKKQGFTRSPPGQKWDIGRRIEQHRNGTEMGHGMLARCSILFKRNPPICGIRPQIAPNTEILV